jgi:hypothetical protein
MKTSIDMLKTIPDSIIRKKAMHNLLIQHDKEVICFRGIFKKRLFKINKFVYSSNITGAICEFSFNSSKEGSKYWDKVFSAYLLLEYKTRQSFF